jgi:cation channel sperm-associated protein 3
LKDSGFQDIIKGLAGALRHDEVAPTKQLCFNSLWLETFVVTLHYHENALFRCQQNHFAIAHALAEYGIFNLTSVEIRLNSKPI